MCATRTTAGWKREKQIVATTGIAESLIPTRTSVRDDSESSTRPSMKIMSIDLGKNNTGVMIATVYFAATETSSNLSAGRTRSSYVNMIPCLHIHRWTNETLLERYKWPTELTRAAKDHMCTTLIDMCKRLFKEYEFDYCIIEEQPVMNTATVILQGMFETAIQLVKPNCTVIKQHPSEKHKWYARLYGYENFVKQAAARKRAPPRICQSFNKRWATRATDEFWATRSQWLPYLRPTERVDTIRSFNFRNKQKKRDDMDDALGLIMAHVYYGKTSTTAETVSKSLSSMPPLENPLPGITTTKTTATSSSSCHSYSAGHSPTPLPSSLVLKANESAADRITADKKLLKRARSESKAAQTNAMALLTDHERCAKKMKLVSTLTAGTSDRHRQHSSLLTPPTLSSSVLDPALQLLIT